MPKPIPRPSRHPPSKSAIVRARAAHARFVCIDCGLNFPVRRAARPTALPPLRCLCCEFLFTIADARTREAVRRVMERAGLQRRFGGRDTPSVP